MANETFKFGNTKWAVKEGSVLAYNNENNNFKPLPFTFTRASTATRVNEDGLIEVVNNHIPRIDYTDNSSGHLLLEPARTNLITYSQDINLWNNRTQGTGVAPITTANYAISPDGTQNADRLQCNQVNFGTPNRSDKEIIVSVVNGTTYAFSVWVKSTNDTNQNFTLSPSFVNILSGTLQNVATNEWKKFTIIGTSIVTGNGAIRLGLIDNTNSTTNDILVWGAQCEAGSYATSYIPTNGTTKTRVAETCTGAGNAQVFNDSEGVLFANVAALANDGTDRFISINNGTDDERVVIAFSSTSQTIAGIVTDASSDVTLSDTVTDVRDFHKVAFKYKLNDAALWIDGVEQDTESTITMPTGLDVIDFNGFGAENFYGKIKQIGVYDTALTDTELATLTT